MNNVEIQRILNNYYDYIDIYIYIYVYIYMYIYIYIYLYTCTISKYQELYGIIMIIYTYYIVIYT